MSEQKTIEIYIPLLEEGTPTLRATQAIDLGQNIYKVLPTPWYDPEDEIWEFLPGTFVRCDEVKNYGKSILIAVEKVGGQSRGTE